MTGVSFMELDTLIREEVALRTVELEREKESLRLMSISIAETLINAMEAKDVYLRGHSQRVAELAGQLAEQLVEDHFIRVTDAVGQMIDQ